MYYLVIVQNNNTPAIFGYETYDAALSAFHTEMSYRAEGRTSTTCAIVDSELIMINHETWIAPTTEANEEPVEV